MKVNCFHCKEHPLELCHDIDIIPGCWRIKKQNYVLNSEVIIKAAYHFFFSINFWIIHISKHKVYSPFTISEENRILALMALINLERTESITISASIVHILNILMYLKFFQAFSSRKRLRSNKV